MLEDKILLERTILAMNSKRFIEKRKLNQRIKKTIFHEDALSKITKAVTVGMVGLNPDTLEVVELASPNAEPYFKVQISGPSLGTQTILMNDSFSYYRLGSAMGTGITPSFDRLSIADRKIINNANRQFRKKF